MRDAALSLLQTLTQAHAVSGHEEEVRKIFVSELGGCGMISMDRMGSVFCEIGGHGPRVMIAGHMDEVGFMVQSITPDGFLQFVTLGGWWEHVLLAQRVEILTRSGEKILGIISSRPPHFLPLSDRRQVMSIEQIYIDVGAVNRQEVTEKFGISLGDPVAPISPWTPMAGEDLYAAKALDNRLGMACAIQAGKILAATSHPNCCIITGTVQEEVGLRGAKPAAAMVRPDVAIVLEAPPADDTPGFSRSDSQARLGGGVQIRAFDPTAITNPRLLHLAIETAQREGIPYQVAVRRSGGTDAGSIHVSTYGVPCIVLGVPTRYIHSHNGMMNLLDYIHMLELTIALVKRMDEATVDQLVAL
ncbi:MAG: M42 family peptidase [Verrucomicrobia bacterium]|nr:MAG: M42 family peptidase [Verrucomicrobiota bacterium]